MKRGLDVDESSYNETMLREMVEDKDVNSLGGFDPDEEAWFFSMRSKPMARTAFEAKDLQESYSHRS